MSNINRRDFTILAASGAVVLGGCAAKCPAVAAPARAPGAVDVQAGEPEAEAAKGFAWLEEEIPRVEAERPDFDVIVRGCSDSLVLRSRARKVPTGLDITYVEGRMIETMKTAGGVGIAGPQVGLFLRVAVLELGYKTDSPTTIFVRNPVITERSDETVDGYEGCLSIPGVGGLVRRNRWIRVEHETAEGEIVTTEAEDHNAILWQHELDHLEGILYIDKLLGELMPMEEVRRLRKEMEERGKEGASDQALNDLGGDCPEGASWIVPGSEKLSAAGRFRKIFLA